MGRFLPGDTKRLLRRGVGLSAGQGATWALAVVWVVVVPRSLGPAGLGRYVFAVSVLTIATALGTIGLDIYVARAIARGDPDEEIAAGLAAGAGGASLGAVGGMLVAMAVAGTVPALFLAAGFLAQAGGNVALAVFQGRERPGVRAALDVGAKSVFTAGSVWAVANGGGLGGVAAAYLAGYAMYGLTAWALAIRMGWLPAAHPTAMSVRTVVRRSAPLGGHLLAQAVYYRADSTMLAPLRGPREAGRYGAAYRLFDTLSFVTTVYGAVISPRLAHLARAEPAEGHRLVRRSMVFMAVLGAGTGGAMAATAAPVIRLLYGAGYASAVGPLRLLGVALAISFVVTPLAWALVATDRQGVLAGVSWAAAAFNVGANLLAIPRWGAMGAAATTVATESVVLVLQWRAVRAGPLGRGSAVDRWAGDPSTGRADVLGDS